MPPESRPTAALDVAGLDQLLTHLRESGFEVIGPVVRDHTIVHAALDSLDDLPVGCIDDQDQGRYRLARSAGEALFGYAVGPGSWKELLFPSRAPICSALRAGDEINVSEPEPDDRRLAFLGVRPCDLRAIGVQDRVFLDERSVDPIYRSRRADALVIAVNCTEPGGTCFCASMGSGPIAEDGYDIALTELCDGGRHTFVVDVGSMRGEEVLQAVPHRAPTTAESEAARQALDAAEARMGRYLDASDLHELLATNLDHPRWDQVADRCLSCANCTMVCPTCFCSTVHDTTDLSGTEAQRWRVWDSCFTSDHSSLHGSPVRSGTRSRYRQWLTHKFGTWHDQFGVSGCVGCGRCITWCPEGIDVTEELAAIRSAPGRSATPVEISR